MNHWLMKSEPDTFGIDTLAVLPRRTTAWDGVRNYQARNMLRDSMKIGDTAFFYHSGCEIPGIAGIIRVVKEGYADKTAFDPKHHHFDPASDPRAPRWFVVDVTLVRRFKRLIALEELRKHADGALADLAVLRRGNRLSVTPVSKAEWDFVLTLE
ncbi:MAG: EVE domain-containing protein [Steroidobacteraceae bacterium]